MLICGLATDHNGASHLVVLQPNSQAICYRASIQPPLSAGKAARWVNRVASRFAPTPLWIAVSGIKWHWLETLETLPVRWVHYRCDIPDAHGMAIQLRDELRDQVSYTFIRSCADRLAQLIEREMSRDPPQSEADF